MNVVNDLLLNYYFLSFIIAWILSIIIKTLLVAISKRSSLSLKDGFKNGGMPSSHGAVVSAISMAILLREGFSALFFVAVVFSAIVITDAFRLRRNVGAQGDSINMLLKKSKEKPLDIVYGHTGLQVFVGILIGIIVPILLLLLTNNFW